MRRRRIVTRPPFPKKLDDIQKRQLKSLKAPTKVIQKALEMEFNVIDAATGNRIHLS